MPFVVNRDGIFECRRSSINQAGNGVFCSKNVKAGTILPYYGVAIKDPDADDDDADSARTYMMAADYSTPYGRQRTLPNTSVDGDPRLPQMRGLEEFKKMACQTNEASDFTQPNCLLVSNPRISRVDIKRSLAKKVPILITYVVVVHNLPKGTELFTCYGDDYGERDYAPCKIDTQTYHKLADRAHKFVDALPRHFSTNVNPKV